LFAQDEIDWVQLFVNWAVDAIGHYVTYRQMRERARQLASLSSGTRFCPPRVERLCSVELGRTQQTEKISHRIAGFEASVSSSMIAVCESSAIAISLQSG